MNGAPRPAEPDVFAEPWQAEAFALVVALLAVVTSGLAVVRNQHCRSEGWTMPEGSPLPTRVKSEVTS